MQVGLVKKLLKPMTNIQYSAPVQPYSTSSTIIHMYLCTFGVARVNVKACMSKGYLAITN